MTDIQYSTEQRRQTVFARETQRLGNGKDNPMAKLNEEVTILGLPGGEVKGKIVSLEPLKVKVAVKVTKFTFDDPLPELLDTLEFRTVLASWLRYKGRSAYKPEGLRSLIAQANKRASEHGVSAVIDAMQMAMSNDWKGWNFDNSFDKKAGGRSDPRGNIANLNSYLAGLEADYD